MRQGITQEDGMGCGAACVAFIAGKDYRESATLLGELKAKTGGFHLKELVDGLNYFGFGGYFKHIKSNDHTINYRDGAIVFVKRSARYPHGHYLARYKNTWMDPWINLPFDKNIKNARSGFRRKLPGKAQYVIFLH